ncbi:hypothetical protein HK414_14645 [Ramlibacter terrae]|uniref:Uncharacterized protein n=1 Tax=Ramlibacter terrae TaxID=2732511 RepID=A0ABX6P4R3_9BURK|nr:hypothetical protein HK414_14645 [Ramlibacter terrae]
MGALQYLPQLFLQRVDSKEMIGIHLIGAHGLLAPKPAGEDLQGAGEQSGLMAYGAFRVALKPGDYEIFEAVNWRGGIDKTSATRDVNFRPVRFRIEAGVPAYLGRIAFVPRLVELPKMAVRPGWEHAGTRGGPTHKIDGFHLWLRDGLESDRRLARVDAPAVQSLIDTLVEQDKNFFRREVRYEEIDHNGLNVH